MSFYNTFNELKSTTGTFLTFSQYMEDLTKWAVYNSEYRVVPSKFVTLLINASGYDNSSLPDVLNDFEKKCTDNRSRDNWTPSSSKSLFWDTLSNDSYPLIEAKNYVGDINIQSYNEHDGIGYSEIYCYIPNEAKENTYELDSNYDLNKISTTNNASFNINSIVVLYDIIDGAGEVLHRNIPMGIYFTGKVQNGTITNGITKFVTSDEIFGAGTSYGLRICSRFLVAPSSQLVLDNIEVHSENNSDLSKVLSQISISQTKMDELINKRYEVDQNYKNLLSIFKNSRTNVPYIRNINGMNYWFVNGKMVSETAVINNDNDCKCLDLDASINNNIISWLDHSSLYIKEIEWNLSKNGGQIGIDRMYINDEEIPVITTPMQISVERPETSIEPHIICYDLKAVVDSEEAYATTYVKFVWPSYLGLVKNTSNTPSQIISESRYQEYKYTNTNGSYICYEYPESFGELTSIKDSRDIEYINDFVKTSITKTFKVNSNTYTVPYFRYIDKHPANVTNYTLKFS